VEQLLRDGARRLGGVGGSPRLDAELLLAHALGQGREDLYRSLFATVPAHTEARYAELLARRETRCPVAQLTGHREFWSLKLEVTGATLVPRPETELLVERVLCRIPVDAAWSVADLGTGSGAIALAVARERGACRVTATDLSKPALTVARRNARTLGIANVTFRQGDWFEALSKRGAGEARFHVLVSNPPYISASEWNFTDQELRFEPRVALDGGPDGLTAFRVITAQATGYLHAGGWLLLEHGFRQGDQVRALLKQAGLNHITTYPDLAGRPRVTEGRFGAPP